MLPRRRARDGGGRARRPGLPGLPRRRIGSACAPTTRRSAPTGEIKRRSRVVQVFLSEKSLERLVGKRCCATSTRSGGGGATSRRKRWPSSTPTSPRRSPGKGRPSPSEGDREAGHRGGPEASLTRWSPRRITASIEDSGFGRINPLHQLLRHYLFSFGNVPSTACPRGIDFVRGRSACPSCAMSWRRATCARLQLAGPVGEMPLLRIVHSGLATRQSSWRARRGGRVGCRVGFAPSALVGFFAFFFHACGDRLYRRRHEDHPQRDGRGGGGRVWWASFGRWQMRRSSTRSASLP